MEDDDAGRDVRFEADAGNSVPHVHRAAVHHAAPVVVRNSGGEIVGAVAVEVAGDEHLAELRVRLVAERGGGEAVAPHTRQADRADLGLKRRDADRDEDGEGEARTTAAT